MAYGLRFINDNGNSVVDYDASQVQIYKTLPNIEPGALAYGTTNTIASHGDNTDSSYKGAVPIVLPQNIDREEVFIFVAADDLTNWDRSFSIGVHYGTVTGVSYSIPTTTVYLGQNYIDVSASANMGSTSAARSTPDDYSGTTGLIARPCTDNRGSGTQKVAPDPAPRDLVGGVISSTILPGGSATVTSVTTSTYNNNPVIRLYLNKNVSASGSLRFRQVTFSTFNCFYLCDSVFKTAGTHDEKFKVKVGMLNDQDDEAEKDDYGIRIRNPFGSAQQTVFNFSTNREMFTGDTISATRTDQVPVFSNNHVLQTNATPPHNSFRVLDATTFEDTYVLMNPCFGCTAGYADNGSTGSYSFSEPSDTVVGYSPMITFKPTASGSGLGTGSAAIAELTTIAWQNYNGTYEPDGVSSNVAQIFMSPGAINSKKNAGLQSSFSHTWASQRPLLVGKIQ